MRKSFGFLVSTVLIAIFTAGCAGNSFNLCSIAGVNVKDLEKATVNGKVKVVPLGYDAAFDKVTEILKNNDLTIFQSSRKKKRIVAMGFKQQTNTTRVGIFFEEEAGQTRITLSSLSSSALAKAEAIIFAELK